MEIHEGGVIRNCVIKLREDCKKRRDKVYVGCGAGFGGDRPLAALKLLQRVKELNYIVLECLAERTLAERYQVMVSGGDGYDSRISDWMRLLLPLAVDRGTCIITNMGAMDPPGAQEKVIEIASSLGLSVSVAVAHEISLTNIGSASHEKSFLLEGGISTYLGAAPIVECLEKYQPNVIITSRVADAALFLAPMIYELGWNWDNLEQLAQGSLAGHLLECGCQLTGGYFMHPGDKSRDMSSSQLLDLSLPYAEISSDGKVCVAKAEGSGGVLNFSTCAQQLLYEIGNPGAYVTPDVIIDIRDVSFYPLSSCKVLCAGAKPSAVSVPDKLLRLVPKDYGWKGWGEISYGGFECVKRAKIAEFLVRSWMEEVIPDVSSHVVSYIVGLDSLKATGLSDSASCQMVSDIRLRMDGLFKLKEHAVQFITGFTALYTNGPAGGGGGGGIRIYFYYILKERYCSWALFLYKGLKWSDGFALIRDFFAVLPLSYTRCFHQFLLSSTAIGFFSLLLVSLFIIQYDIEEVQQHCNHTFSQQEIVSLYERFCQLDHSGLGFIFVDEFLSVPEFAPNPLSQFWLGGHRYWGRGIGARPHLLLGDASVSSTPNFLFSSERFDQTTKLLSFGVNSERYSREA